MAHHPRLPRVYLIRHGETEWSLNGKHTGVSDIPLTENGVRTVSAVGPKIAGPGKLLDPANVLHAFISPRQRAQKTFELMFAHLDKDQIPKSIDENVREWDYGEYDGKTPSEIRKGNPSWQIWEDGCPGGESAKQMEERVDRVIQDIIQKSQTHHTAITDASTCRGDIWIFTHGHFSRVFLTRWCRLNLSQGRIFVSDPGSVSVCGYQHGNFEERSLLAVNLYGHLS